MKIEYTYQKETEIITHNGVCDILMEKTLCLLIFAQQLTYNYLMWFTLSVK